MDDNPFRGGPPVAVEALVRTRAGLHEVAEQVLAADLYRHTGRIGLRPTPGGFGTPRVIVDGVARQVRVEGAVLVLTRGEEQARLALRTVADAAAFLGIEPGAPPVYRAVTEVRPERDLDLDDAAVRALGAWLAFGDRALERFAAVHGGEAPTTAQLWPEHFDLAVSVGEVNYGVSPGDDDHPEPYAYVGPWTPPPLGSDGGYWNEPFGRSDPASCFGDAADLAVWFDEGRAHR